MTHIKNYLEFRIFFSYSTLFLNTPNLRRSPLLALCLLHIVAVPCWSCKLKYFLTRRFRKMCAVTDRSTIFLICYHTALASTSLMVLVGGLRQLQAVNRVFAKHHTVHINTKNVAFLPSSRTFFTPPTINGDTNPLVITTSIGLAYIDGDRISYKSIH